MFVLVFIILLFLTIFFGVVAKTRQIKIMFVMFLLVTIYVGYIGIVNTGYVENNKVKTFKSMKTDYWVKAQYDVTQKLKTPSKAKFPMFSEEFIEKKDKDVFVYSYVDSQNSFGATVRTRFMVKFVNGDLENSVVIIK